MKVAVCCGTSLAAFALVSAGCGGVPAPVEVDAADAPVDAPTGATVCDPLARFGEPKLLVGFDTDAIEGTARLSYDELTIYLSANLGSSDINVFTASRARRGDNFGAITPVSVSSMTALDYDPSVSRDGLLLVWAVKPGNAAARLHAATRATPVGDFTGTTTVANVAAAGTSEEDAQPFLTSDGQELWFTSTRAPTAGGWDIWRAVKSGAGFANPTRMLELNSDSVDFLPTLSEDRLTVYLSSTRPGSQMFDIYRARRSTTSDGFSTPTLVPELNSPQIEHPTWLSPDGCRLYLTSNRRGTHDLFVAERQP